MKYFNISSNKKKLLLTISLLLLTFSFSFQFEKSQKNFSKNSNNQITSISNENKKNFLSEKNRNLQYSLGSIYYELQYPINDLTGTGDRLKDVPYKVQCKILACESGCCVGEIDKMSCGPAADCAIYQDSLNTGRLIISVCIVVILLVIFFIFCLIYVKIFKFGKGTSVCLALGSMTVILIPLVVYWILQERKNRANSKKE